MTDKADNLLPCPFCGEKAQSDRLNGYSNFYKIICPTVGCRGQQCAWYTGHEKAVAAWNTRTPPDSVTIKREVVEKVNAALQDVPCYCDEVEDGECTVCEYRSEALALLDDALKGKT